MFTDQDVKDAKQVEPLDYATRVSVRMPMSDRKEKKVPFFAPAMVIFTLMLVTAPKGTVLETIISAYNATKQAFSKQTQSSNPYSIRLGNTSINSTNSNVQSIQVINNGGQVSVSSKK